MPLSLPHNGENPNKRYAVLLGIRVRGCTSIEDSDFISVYCPGDGDNEREQASLRLQELEDLDDNIYKLNNKSSSIKLEFSKPSIRKSKNESLRKAILS